MGTRIKTTYLSIQEIGTRTNQEDSIFPALGQIIAGNDLFILCDGMGGHDCGEIASNTVCQVMSSLILENSDIDFDSALGAAYNALDQNDNNAEKKMGTTLAFLKFEGRKGIVAHIGDSRVYHIRPSERRILYVTRDHSLVNELIACGELSQEEAQHSPQKNIITRVMQPHQEQRTKADVKILSDIRVGDYFYMCSDGMLEVSEDQDIVNVLSMDISDQEKVEILKGVTRNNRDNHSAHIIHVIGIEEIEKSKDIEVGGRKHSGINKFILLMLILSVALAIIFGGTGYFRKSLPPTDTNEESELSIHVPKIDCPIDVKR